MEVSKRAILNSALVRDNVAYITHGEENMDTTEMGMIAAVDATKTGVLTADAFKWKTHGFLPTFASPVMDDERLYTVDNSAIVGAFDLKTGARLWDKTLGTLQKGSPLLADGKLYVGTENGKFFILKPSATGVEVLDEDVLGTRRRPEAIVASPIVADGRVYVTSMDATSTRSASGRPARAGPAPTVMPRSSEPAASVQVFPYDTLVAPGGKQTFTLRLFDAKGNFIREEPAGNAVVGRSAEAAPSMRRACSPPATATRAGFVKATVGARQRHGARARGGAAAVELRLREPWWRSAAVVVDGRAGQAVPAHGRGRRQGAGAAARRNRRAAAPRCSLGRPTWSGYTIEADVRGREQRRQRGDVGLINERYGLVLFGNGQKLELQPWQAADEMTVRVPFKWDPDKWYRMKLRVDNQPNGQTRVRGKVWPAGDAEPAAWTIEKIDTIPHRDGQPRHLRRRDFGRLFRQRQGL